MSTYPTHSFPYTDFHDNNLDFLLSKYQAIVDDIDQLKSRVTSAESDITSLTTRMTAAEGNISSLSSRMSTAEGNISSLSSRMSTAEGNITSNTNNITSLTSRMSTAEGNISSLSTRMTTAEGNITSNTNNITSLTSRMSAAESNITALGNTVSGYSSSITSLDTRVSALEQASSKESMEFVIRDPNGNRTNLDLQYRRNTQTSEYTSVLLRDSNPDHPNGIFTYNEFIECLHYARFKLRDVLTATSSEFYELLLTNLVINSGSITSINFAGFRSNLSGNQDPSMFEAFNVTITAGTDPGTYDINITCNSL